ncbi:MAG: HIT family protein [Trueperella sp.]|nr:HIT family protein [Trueperella sp.]
MASVFSKIIAGEIPGKFVWADADCVAIATIEPVRPGHVLVIPRQEVERFSDLPPELFAHLAQVSQIIGKAQQKAFAVDRAILVLLGFEVPHTHIHLVPANSEADADMRLAAPAPDAEITAAMEQLRTALVDLGYGENVPAELSNPGLR